MKRINNAVKGYFIELCKWLRALIVPAIFFVPVLVIDFASTPQRSLTFGIGYLSIAWATIAYRLNKVANRDSTDDLRAQCAALQQPMAAIASMWYARLERDVAGALENGVLTREVDAAGVQLGNLYCEVVGSAKSYYHTVTASHIWTPGNLGASLRKFVEVNVSACQKVRIDRFLVVEQCYLEEGLPPWLRIMVSEFVAAEKKSDLMPGKEGHLRLYVVSDQDIRRDSEAGSLWTDCSDFVLWDHSDGGRWARNDYSAGPYYVRDGDHGYKGRHAPVFRTVHIGNADTSNVMYKRCEDLVARLRAMPTCRLARERLEGRYRLPDSREPLELDAKMKVAREAAVDVVVTDYDERYGIGVAMAADCESIRAGKTITLSWSDCSDSKAMDLVDFPSNRFTVTRSPIEVDNVWRFGAICESGR
ncbi:MAG: hypothetical protein H6832_09340 [Planctomycetes bacterium]|nr:hypothetical protein [Planctomycetota bacterium]